MQIGSVDRKRAISDRRRNRAFLHSRKSVVSIPTFSIDQSDPRIPSQKPEFFNGMRGSDCSIRDVVEAHRTSHHPRKHTITPCNSSGAGLAATVAAAASAHSQSAWHILFSARWRQCVLSMTFLQHRCCCSARFGDS